jgi:hypothetical protein
MGISPNKEQPLKEINRTPDGTDKTETDKTLSQSQLRHAPYQLIRNSVCYLLLECDSGVITYIPKEAIPVITESLRSIMDLSLNEPILYQFINNLIEDLIDFFLLEYNYEAFICIPRKILSSAVVDGHFLMMELFRNKEQISHKLKTYWVISSLTIRQDDWENRVSEGFTSIPGEIIRAIASDLDDLAISSLKQTCRCIFAIITRKWLPVQLCVALWPGEEIKKSLKWNLEELFPKFCKKRATNSNKDPVCYFNSKMDQHPPHKTVVDPSQWNLVGLKGKTNDSYLNESWVDYLKECEKMVYLRLDCVNNIRLDIRHLTKLEEFFMKLKLRDGHGASISLPTSIKSIILHATVKKNQGHCDFFSQQSIYKLHLKAPDCTRLEFW